MDMGNILLFFQIFISIYQFNLMQCQVSAILTPKDNNSSLPSEPSSRNETKVLVTTTTISSSQYERLDASMKSTNDSQPKTSAAVSSSKSVDSVSASATSIIFHPTSKLISNKTVSPIFTKSSTDITRKSISTSFTMNSTIVNYSTLRTVNQTSISITSHVFYPSIFDSTLVIPSATVNVTNSTIAISTSSVPLICPTTTVYINCSSTFFTIKPTSVTRSTSTSWNFTSSFYNHSATKTIYDSTSSSLATATLTSIPSFATTSSYDITSTIIPSSTIFVISTAVDPILPTINKCDIYLEEFTKAYTKFSECMLLNMHPMRVCSNCSTFYENFSKHHRKIFKDCGRDLIYGYNMQYQVIPKMFATQDLTWKSLECEKCYMKNNEGETQYTPKFEAFIELYTKLNNCFKNHTHYSWIHTDNGTSIRSRTFDKLICTECFDLYNTMQINYEYYGINGEDSSSEWCADINVEVNETRHRWSNDFKCGKKEKDLESVIALTCFFCFLPIVFYVGAKIHADVRERKSVNRFNYSLE